MSCVPACVCRCGQVSCGCHVPGPRPTRRSATSTKPVSECPVCHSQTLVVHCERVQCRWLKCRNQGCDAQLDPATGRGHIVSPDGDRSKDRVRVTFDLPGGRAA